MSASTSHPKRRRDRTFTGCLTCRRRKVKCDNSPFPCEKCRALNLECLPPFTSNLRFVTSSLSSTSLKQNVSKSAPIYNQAHAPPSLTGRGYELPILNRGDWYTGLEAATTYLNVNMSQPSGTIPPNPDALESYYTAQNSVLEAVPDIALFNQAFDHFPTPEIMNSFFSDPLFTDSSLQTFDNNPNSLNPLDQTVGFVEDEVSSSTLQVDAACSENCTRSPYAISPTQDNVWSPYAAFSPSLNKLRLFLTPIDTTEVEVLQHYQLFVSKAFSVKNPKWNIYTYIFRVARAFPYSPVRSSLLAWSGYLISKNGEIHAANAAYQYHKAQIEVQSLIESMHLLNYMDSRATNSPHVVVLTPTTALLITMFFLCQCDVYTCSWESYINRLRSFKMMLIQRWDNFSQTLQSLDYRLLLWLSYLDIRASIWSLTEQRQISPCSRNLLDIVLERENIQCLYRKSRTYLQDAFQNEYPSLELRHDMLQDPANEKLGEAMSILGLIIALGKNNYATRSGKSFCEKSKEVAEIRIKLKAIQEECDLALQGFHVFTKVEVNRLSYHWLNLKATHNSALILLNRIVWPEIRTNEESQKAAGEILHITLELKKANMMHNPHFIISPFFMFVAGIEILDPIYQQWTLTILREFQNWGKNVHKVIQLLESVILLQEQGKSRVNVGELMEERGLKFII